MFPDTSLIDSASGLQQALGQDTKKGTEEIDRSPYNLSGVGSVNQDPKCHQMPLGTSRRLVFAKSRMELPTERVGSEDRAVQQACSSQCLVLYMAVSELLDFDWTWREAYFPLNPSVAPAICGT